MRYTGCVTTWRSSDRFGFIGLASVTKEDGSPHRLETVHDIYVHEDDCTAPLDKGVQIVFGVTADLRRGGATLRAVAVKYIVAQDLVLVGDDQAEQRALADVRSLYVPPVPAQRLGMKPIPDEAVQQVLVNRPMPKMPRGGKTTGTPAEITRRLMEHIFPQFSAINEKGVDMADEKFDDVIKQAISDHEALGMKQQAEHMGQRARMYKGLRNLMRSEEDLLRPETFIPIEYLPDLFMAVPVWYFWTDKDTTDWARNIQNEPNPPMSRKLQYFCDQVPAQRWVDTFLMFNRRLRTLPDYSGDIIPPRIVARMRKSADLFDHLVIMTPYHDVAGKNWEELQWRRSVDPYVVGFLKGIPLMVVLGRFSDSGTFPLYSELVADTIAFLRTNSAKLRGFNSQGVLPRWYFAPDGAEMRQPNYPHLYKSANLGDHLMGHTKSLLHAFDNGNLFNWLRGEGGYTPTAAA